MTKLADQHPTFISTHLLKSSFYIEGRLEVKQSWLQEKCPLYTSIERTVFACLQLPSIQLSLQFILVWKKTLAFAKFDIRGVLWRRFERHKYRRIKVLEFTVLFCLVKPTFGINTFCCAINPCRFTIDFELGSRNCYVIVGGIKKPITTVVCPI